MRPDDQIILFNGDGREHQATLIEITKRSVKARIIASSQPDSESPLSVSIGQTLSRGERMDYAVQKSTEMGVKTITPLFSERCEVKLPKERQEKRVNHWQQIAVSACEQSGRTVPPEITFPADLRNLVKCARRRIKIRSAPP